MKTPEQEIEELKQSVEVLSRLTVFNKAMLDLLTDRYTEEKQLRKQLREELDSLRREYRLYREQHPPEEAVMF